MSINAGNENLLTEAQAAKLLALSPRTLQAWRLRGAGPKVIKFGGLRGAVRYRREDLAAFVAHGLQASSIGDHAA